VAARARPPRRAPSAPRPGPPGRAAPGRPWQAPSAAAQEARQQLRAAARASRRAHLKATGSALVEVGRICVEPRQSQGTSRLGGHGRAPGRARSRGPRAARRPRARRAARRPRGCTAGRRAQTPPCSACARSSRCSSPAGAPRGTSHNGAAAAERDSAYRAPAHSVAHSVMSCLKRPKQKAGRRPAGRAPGSSSAAAGTRGWRPPPRRSRAARSACPGSSPPGPGPRTRTCWTGSAAARPARPPRPARLRPRTRAPRTLIRAPELSGRLPRCRRVRSLLEANQGGRSVYRERDRRRVAVQPCAMTSSVR